MIRNVHPTAVMLGMLAVSSIGLGCGGNTPAGLHPVTINATPDNVLSPEAPDEKKPARPDADKPPKAPAPNPPAAKAAAEKTGTDKPAVVRLVAIPYDELKARIVADKAARLTMIDVWSTNCPPCKENFPHVVRMNEKYKGKGLAVISLSMDPPDDPKAVSQAEEFLRDQKATFTNLRFSDAPEVGYEGLEFAALPAVFLFTPDGKIVKRFTYDDPNNQFTYDEVEKDVEARLSAPPADGKG